MCGIEEFERIPINNMSKGFRTSVNGVGINDAWYKVLITINGKSIQCPYYSKWAAMMRRCYSSDYHKKRPRAKGSSVDPRWIKFSGFLKWAEQQGDITNLFLDEDIINPGNKIYAPENCTFVSSRINSLLTDHAAAGGDYPIGVSLTKSGKYLATGGDVKRNFQKSLGVFDTIGEAVIAYNHNKCEIVKILSEEFRNTNPSLFKGLNLHAEIIYHNKWGELSSVVL